MPGDQPTPRRYLFWGGMALLAVAIFIAGIMVGGHPEQTGLSRLPGPLRNVLVNGSVGSLPDQVIDVLAQRYRGPIDRQHLEQVAAAAAAQSLGNRWTQYLTPEQYRELTRASEGKYSGIGIRVRQVKDGIGIREVFTGSPAQKAGLKAGDVIVSVGGVPVATRGLQKSVLAIAGKPGTKVALGIRGTDGTSRTVDVTRGDVTVPLVEGKIVQGNGCTVAVVALDRFDVGAGEAVKAEVEKLMAKGATAVVLDLRGDPGGLVDEAVAVASDFLPKGKKIVTIKGRSTPLEVRTATGDPIPAGTPLTVLVDGNSASASEIVTGALKDNGRAVVVGTPTFGKSEVQVTQPTTDGGAIKVTIAGYLTPKGTDIGKKGITPDVTAADDPVTEQDEAVQVAVSQACTAPHAG